MAAASMRAARSSAMLDGASRAIDPNTVGVTDPILAGAVRVAAAIGSLAGTWPRSPLQVLARLHVLAAADLAPAAELGRPVAGGPAMTARLGRLSRAVGTSTLPGPLQVAAVHGELLALNPFPIGGGVVARAAARLTMISCGFDPAGISVPEAGLLRDRARYVALTEQLRAEGMPGRQVRVAWSLQVCHCLVEGCREGRSIADTVT